MNITGTQVAQAARMRERALPSNPSLLTTPAPTDTAPVNEPQPQTNEADEGLDKYDISTLACTD